jgi:hypothetical protein
MKNKNYYMDLADRWFDALLTRGEERELKSFLATTEDPDFDEIKAVAGFFVAGKAIATSRATAGADSPRRTLHWAAALVVAASLALIAAIGLHHRQNDCYILVYGQKSTNPNLVLDDMTATLEGIFGEGEDVGDELFDLFNPAL